MNVSGRRGRGTGGRRFRRFVRPVNGAAFTAATAWLATIAWLAAGTVAEAQPNPYRVVEGWLDTDGFRVLGSVSGVYPDGRGNVWIAERCGANSCVEHEDLAPIIAIDPAGRAVRSFGAGHFAWPHGIYVDADGNVWVTDGRGGRGKGHQVTKFSPAGDVLLTLGTAGVAGRGPVHFNGPTGVVVAPDGSIFVADGHETESNHRIVKFSAQGAYLLEWGGLGAAPGEFNVPHALAMDSRGRLFVADRDNNRIQIFDQNGRFLEEWTQFGRPSGIFIAPDDTLYVSDNQSDNARHGGWHRGIRVGSARDGSVAFFIPDPDFDPENSQETSAHGIAADAEGNIYGAEVWSETVKKYE
jgi:DNA-binding beta-propeller fold protein YncE